MTTTFLDKQQKHLLKKFHVLLAKAGIDEDGKRYILAGYGVDSSKSLTAYELMEVCNKLELQTNPAAAELDKWRKRVLAAVYGYFNKLGMSATMNTIKGTATRAAQEDNFNNISLERLRTLYYAFNKKQKDVVNVGVALEEVINEIKSLN